MVVDTNPPPPATGNSSEGSLFLCPKPSRPSRLFAKRPRRLRSKLNLAAGSCILYALLTILLDSDNFATALWWVEVCGFLIIGVPVLFTLVYRFPGIHRFLGWGLLFQVPLIAWLMLAEFRGFDLGIGLLAMFGATVATYLLLLDTDIRRYRQRIKRRIGAGEVAWNPRRLTSRRPV